MTENDRVQRLDADLDLLAARIGGVSHDVDGVRANVTGLTEDMTKLAEQLLELTRALGNVAEKMAAVVPKAVSDTGPPAKNRKVWVSIVPEGDEYGVGPCQVMIEQFGDKPPSVAFRRKHPGNQSWNLSTWGRPYTGVAQ